MLALISKQRYIGRLLNRWSCRFSRERYLIFRQIILTVCLWTAERARGALSVCAIKDRWMNCSLSLSPSLLSLSLSRKLFSRKKGGKGRRAYREIGVIIYFISTRKIDLCVNYRVYKLTPYLRNTPPRRLAFKHSGGDSRLCTSATVTLYLLVLLSNDNRPGTEQNTSDGCAFPDNIAFSLLSEGFISAKLTCSKMAWKWQDDSKI